MTRTRLLLVMILSVGLSTFGQLGGTISAQPAVRDRAYEVERTDCTGRA